MFDDANPYEALQNTDTSFMSEVWRFSGATLAGIIFALLVHAVFAWPWRKPNAKRLQIGWPLALGIGFLLGALLFTGRPKSMFTEDQDRLLALILPAIVVIEVATVFVPGYVAWILRGLFAFALGRVLLHDTVWLVDPTGMGLSKETWSTLEAVFWLGGIGAVLLGGRWMVLQFGSASRRNGYLTLVLAITALVAGGTIMHFGYLTAGKLAITLGALVLTTAIAAIAFRWPIADGLIGVAITLLFTLLLMGLFFGSLSLLQALLLLSAPFAACLKGRGVRYLAPTVPLAFVILPQVVPLDDVLEYNTRVVLAGVTLLGAASGVVGCFAVLRRRALTGDALAHAALPGVCIAYLLVRQREEIALLLGAFVSGIAGISVISALRRWTRIKEDAAIGIVLGVFFGAGIFLLSLATRMPGGSASGLNSYLLGQTASMIWEKVVPIGVLAVAALLAVSIMYKELKLVSFDSDFAQAQGWPAFWLDLLMMALVAATVVVGLPAVGVVMMAALLIIPAATARFWTDRLRTMLLLAAVVGAAMGLIGTMASSTYGWPAGPAIILVGSVLFTASALLAPRRGLVARALTLSRFRWQLQQRKLLRLLLEILPSPLGGEGLGVRGVNMESAPAPSPPAPLPQGERGVGATFDEVLRRKSWSPRRLRQLIANAERQGWVHLDSGTIRLTGAGVDRAKAAVRGQRLWELFLHEYPELARSYATLSAESIEDVLPESLVQELIAKLPPASTGAAEGAT